MKALTRVGALLLAVLLLAACSPAQDTSSSQQTSQTSTGSQSTSNGSKDPIKFAFIGPLTGDNMQYGISMRQGVELRLNEFNEADGLDGRLIDMAWYDDKNDAKETVIVCNQAISDPDVWIVFGPFSSTCSMAISPILQKAEIIHYALQSSHPEGTAAGDWVFRGTRTQEIVCEQYAKFVYDYLDVTSVAILYLNNDWGKSVSELFESYFTGLGGEIPVNEPFIEGQTRDFTPMISKMKASGAEAYYVIAQYNDTATAFNQMASLDVEGIKIVADSSMRGELIDLAGDNLEGAYGMTGFYLDNPYEPFVALRQKLKDVYGADVEINSFNSNGYDCMDCICTGLLTVGADKFAMKDWMTNLKDFDGVVGKWSFDAERNATKPLYAQQVQNGQFVLLERIEY